MPPADDKTATERPRAVGAAATASEREQPPASGTDPTVIDRPSANREPVAASPAPVVIGRFVVEKELGAGGMGVVLLAHDSTLDRRVAIKVLRDDRDKSSHARVRMLREAQAMARLRHPNVVTVYEAGMHEGQVFLVMELVGGGTLRERLVEKPPVREILRLFLEAGEGLAAAHRAGLVHRDFKPANVLVDEHGHAKVTDFGLAAQDSSDERKLAPTVQRSSAPEVDALSQSLTQTGDLLGTPRYMAPEQHAGRETDPRSDQFTFCVALYEALYGRHPFRDDSLESLRASMRDEAPRMPDRAGEAGPRVRDAVMRGLSRDPSQRFASLEPLLAILAPSSPRRMLLLGGLASAAVAMGAVVWLRPVHEEPTIIATRAAHACDCELIDLDAPPGARITGVRPIASGVLGASAPPAKQPTGQLAIPRGPHVIDYSVDDQIYSFAMISRGDGAVRTLALPAPEAIDGYVFVPGGDVEIGDAIEQPIAAVHLAPYLIARDEQPSLVTHDEALRITREQHARLPTAAEWEWAARLGVGHTMLDRRWEWTATAFATYPYVADDRDDALAPRDKSEVRGGDASRAAARRMGSHAGRAELRLARTPVARLALDPVSFDVDTEIVDDDDKHMLRATVPARDRARLDHFLTAWRQRPDQPPLLVEGSRCEVTNILLDAGVPLRLVDERPADGSHVALRLHPLPEFSRAGPSIVTCETETELLDAICFEGITILPSSARTIEALAASMRAQLARKRLEIQSYVGPRPDAMGISQKRADAVRARLIALGVRPETLVARGMGVVENASDPEHALFDDSGPAVPGCPGAPEGERVVFELLP